MLFRSRLGFRMKRLRMIRPQCFLVRIVKRLRFLHVLIQLRARVRCCKHIVNTQPRIAIYPLFHVGGIIGEIHRTACLGLQG
jgi:hypothetical protein